MILTTVQRAALAIFPIGLLVLLGFSIRRAITPPTIFLETPENGSVVTVPLTTLSGRARGAARITLNGVQIPISGADGGFNEAVSLSPGVNLLRVTAKKRHSREAVITRRVIVAGVGENQVNSAQP